MVVLLTGATGFIGRHLAEALRAAGHEVVCAVRRPDTARAGDPCVRHVHADFTRDCDPATWAARLAGVDAVVNAVGLLRESGAQTFESVHVRAPQALFTACVTAGVRRVVQISALGADESAASRYHLSKKAADDALTGLPLEWTIVQPALVYGPGGASARLFTTLASLPFVPVPGRGEQPVQPVHIDDVVQAIVALLEPDAPIRCRIPLVGPVPLRLRDFLAGLRCALGLGRARLLPVPLPLVRLAARIGAVLPGALLDSETLAMLMRGNVGDPGPIARLLRRAPRPVGAFVAWRDAQATRTFAQMQWLAPLLRWSIALVWIVTGIVSLGLYPTDASYALLARTGVTGPLAPVALYGAALLDLAIGIGLLVMRRRRPLWLLQIAVILLYTVIITVSLPEYWLHPYGPILKNLPLLAAIWLLYELER